MTDLGIIDLIFCVIKLEEKFDRNPNSLTSAEKEFLKDPEIRSYIHKFVY